MAVQWENLEVLHKILKWAKEKLTTEEINKKLLLVRDREGNTNWKLAAKKRTLDILQNVSEWAEEKLSTEDINNKLLLGTDNKRRTAWHLTAEKVSYKVQHKM